MKKFLNYVMIFVLLMIITTSVNAQEIYYENSNGISFTKDEYDFFTKMYYDGYQEIMTQEDRDMFEGELDASKIEKVTYTDYKSDVKSISVKGSYHETQAKILQITKYNENPTTVSINAQWKYSPNVRSYDLIGAYLSGPTMHGSSTAKINYTGGTILPSATNSASNGYGSVLLLPSSGGNIVVSSTFRVLGSGNVFASYQHAKSVVSLNNAKSFSISYSGLGNVFYFSNMNIRAKYDAMQGVSIGV